MNDNCLGELHLLADTFIIGRYFMQILCIFSMMIYYADTLCKYIIYIYIYIYIYKIAKAERKWIPTIKEVVTNRKKGPLKCCHVYSFKIKTAAHYNVRLLKSLPRLQLKQIK